MAWIKRNIWIVTLSLVSIIVYPVAWKISSGMNKKLKEELQKEVDTAWRSVDVTVGYSGIQIDPNTPPVEVSGVAPNAKITTFFKEIREKQQSQLNEVVTMAEEFNRHGRKPLVEGLFPEPTGEDPIIVKIAMNKKFVSGPTHPPSAYEELFETINGGPPVDPLSLRDELQDLKQRNLAAREASEGNVALTAEEKAELEKELVDYRLATYRRRALDLSVFVDMSSLPKPDSRSWPQIFDDQLGQPPVTWQCYLWQHDYWTIEDVIEAIGRANTDENGDFTPVTESAVKRIAKLELTAPVVPIESITSDVDPTPGTVTDAGAQPLAPDYAYSVTGRFTSPNNRLYDVRRVKLEVIVAMDKLPRFFDALAETNFITVTDVDLEAVNVAAELTTGYFYGSDYVVKANMTLEVLLLRSWTEPYMPDGIKFRLGIPPQPTGFDDGFGEDDGSGDGGG
jgi:hypothetical protein